jgi:hypothetical protein
MALPDEWAWIGELIAEEGRSLEITVPGVVSDVVKPWRGNAAGSPTAAVGVFVRYKSNEVDGDHIRRGDQKILIIPSETIDIENGTIIKDSLDDSNWNVVDIEKITNKSDILLYILQVRQ